MANLTPNEEAYKVFVELLGRAFYEDLGIDGRVETSDHGILVIILDHFGRNPRWMSKTEISHSLKLSRTKLHRALCFFEDEKIVQRGQDGYSLNFAEMCDAVNYKILQMKKTLQNKHINAEYICPRCDRKYNALDAASLISEDGNTFLCEKCGVEVFSEREKMGGGREIFNELQQKLEEQLKPLLDQLDIVKVLPIPRLHGMEDRREG